MRAWYIDLIQSELYKVLIKKLLYKHVFFNEKSNEMCQ